MPLLDSQTSSAATEKSVRDSVSTFSNYASDSSSAIGAPTAGMVDTVEDDDEDGIDSAADSPHPLNAILSRGKSTSDNAQNQSVPDSKSGAGGEGVWWRLHHPKGPDMLLDEAISAHNELQTRYMELYVQLAKQELAYKGEDGGWANGIAQTKENLEREKKLVNGDAPENKKSIEIAEKIHQLVVARSKSTSTVSDDLATNVNQARSRLSQQKKIVQVAWAAILNEDGWDQSSGRYAPAYQQEILLRGKRVRSRTEAVSAIWEEILVNPKLELHSRINAVRKRDAAVQMFAQSLDDDDFLDRIFAEREADGATDTSGKNSADDNAGDPQDIEEMLGRDFERSRHYLNNYEGRHKHHLNTSNKGVFQEYVKRRSAVIETRHRRDYLNFVRNLKSLDDIRNDVFNVTIKNGEWFCGPYFSELPDKSLISKWTAVGEKDNLYVDLKELGFYRPLGYFDSWNVGGLVKALKSLGMKDFLRIQKMLPSLLAMISDCFARCGSLGKVLYPRYVTYEDFQRRKKEETEYIDRPNHLTPILMFAKTLYDLRSELRLPPSMDDLLIQYELKKAQFADGSGDAGKWLEDWVKAFFEQFDDSGKQEKSSNARPVGNGSTQLPVRETIEPTYLYGTLDPEIEEQQPQSAEKSNATLQKEGGRQENHAQPARPSLDEVEREFEESIKAFAASPGIARHEITASESAGNSAGIGLDDALAMTTLVSPLAPIGVGYLAAKHIPRADGVSIQALNATDDSHDSVGGKHNRTVTFVMPGRTIILDKDDPSTVVVSPSGFTMAADSGLKSNTNYILEKETGASDWGFDDKTFIRNGDVILQGFSNQEDPPTISIREEVGDDDHTYLMEISNADHAYRFFSTDIKPLMQLRYSFERLPNTYEPMNWSGYLNRTDNHNKRFCPDPRYHGVYQISGENIAYRPYIKLTSPFHSVEILTPVKAGILIEVGANYLSDMIKLLTLGYEVEILYSTSDGKRANADEAMTKFWIESVDAKNADLILRFKIPEYSSGRGWNPKNIWYEGVIVIRGQAASAFEWFFRKRITAQKINATDAVQTMAAIRQRSGFCEIVGSVNDWNFDSLPIDLSPEAGQAGLKWEIVKSLRKDRDGQYFFELDLVDEGPDSRLVYFFSDVFLAERFYATISNALSEESSQMSLKIFSQDDGEQEVPRALAKSEKWVTVDGITIDNPIYIDFSNINNRTENGASIPFPGWEEVMDEEGPWWAEWAEFISDMIWKGVELGAMIGVAVGAGYFVSMTFKGKVAYFFFVRTANGVLRFMGGSRPYLFNNPYPMAPDPNPVGFFNTFTRFGNPVLAGGSTLTSLFAAIGDGFGGWSIANLIGNAALTVGSFDAAPGAAGWARLTLRIFYGSGVVIIVVTDARDVVEDLKECLETGDREECQKFAGSSLQLAGDSFMLVGAGAEAGMIKNPSATNFVYQNRGQIQMAGIGMSTAGAAIKLDTKVQPTWTGWSPSESTEEKLVRLIGQMAHDQDIDYPAFGNELIDKGFIRSPGLKFVLIVDDAGVKRWCVMETTGESGSRPQLETIRFLSAPMQGEFDASNRSFKKNPFLVNFSQVAKMESWRPEQLFSGRVGVIDDQGNESTADVSVGRTAEEDGNEYHLTFKTPWGGLKVNLAGDPSTLQEYYAQANSDHDQAKANMRNYDMRLWDNWDYSEIPLNQLNVELPDVAKVFVTDKVSISPDGGELETAKIYLESEGKIESKFS